MGRRKASCVRLLPHRTRRIRSNVARRHPAFGVHFRIRSTSEVHTKASFDLVHVVGRVDKRFYTRVRRRS